MRIGRSYVPWSCDSMVSERGRPAPAAPLRDDPIGIHPDGAGRAVPGISVRMDTRHRAGIPKASAVGGDAS